MNFDAITLFIVVISIVSDINFYAFLPLTVFWVNNYD